ncbi:beta-ketoacyl-[acyl-carrier-protein] synthase II [Flavobacterium aquidurense]|uniref:beta-ketoacyl-ACP synthase II n=1 Tax=Flavobacterium aquidurense TaxID=362413 RepID=UPI000922DDD7|nr:beta-ketoacyl-ACP synthase II [Flavobacterium aquidurense]OXA69706.1 beta-ketoacyl-[acyl-carrier-protein] synthase II [Flavobacterium aquidurense]SHH28676.1 3-oxoacyl-[acyl-carrier-protein] synthase II [Flavobacterium frigidimaris]
MKRVVITGLGAVTPIGNSVPEYWHSLINGVSGAAEITKFDTTQFKTKFACEVKNFDPQHIFEKNEIRKYDLFTQYALYVTDEAIKNANIDFDTLNKDRIGVIWGSGDGGVATFEEQISEYKLGNGIPRFSPFFIPKRIINIASGAISIKYGLRGINYTTASACSASNTAIIDAFNYIRWGKADMIISGGSEASITESSIGGFNASKALSTLNDDCTKASRPFDATRDGFVLGEGAGAIILESYEHAIKRNAVILAEIVGGGLAGDAYHLTGTHPDGEGAILGMELALEEAEITPDKIDYINAHATSTPTGDLSELKAMEKVFGKNPNANISATKSMTGHLLGGAGAIEAIACIKAVQENIVPPTINTKTIETEFKDKFNLTLEKAQPRIVNYAMSNTFGFGGHIASSIFKKFKN